jgi:preprotein translocase SecE subunit
LKLGKKPVAKRFDKVSVSEETNELETATAETTETVGGAPPARVDRGTGGGGRRPKGAHAGPGTWERMVQFLRDVRGEMRRVSWPTATYVKNTSIITLLAVAFFAAYLFGIDQVWAFLIEHLRTWLGG